MIKEQLINDMKQFMKEKKKVELMGIRMVNSLLKSISFSSQLLRLKGVTLHEAHSLLIPFFKASNFVAFVQHLSMFIPQTR